MNYEDIKKLIDDMGNSKLTEISIDFPDGTKIRMKKEAKVVEKVQEKNIQHIEQKEVNEIVETETQEDNCKIVKSPMVGTFYLKPDPNSNPYVEIGKNESIGFGSVPTSYMEEINNACRKGVTIWHNHDNIGNYSLDNSIVS